jgi:hypothetical protein
MTMSLLTNITGCSNSTFEDSFYKNWRRQKKNYKTEIKTWNEKLKQMQEKLDGLQQKQLQGIWSGEGRLLTNQSSTNLIIYTWRLFRNSTKKYVLNLQVPRAVNVDIFVQQTKPVC